MKRKCVLKNLSYHHLSRDATVVRTAADFVAALFCGTISVHHTQTFLRRHQRHAKFTKPVAHLFSLLYVGVEAAGQIQQGELQVADSEGGDRCTEA